MDIAGFLVFGDGIDAYYCLTNGIPVLIVDVDFPVFFVPGWAYVDGTLYVMDANCNIHGSDIDNPASWNALNVIIARTAPGLGVALVRHLTYVVALKENSTEVFQNTGNATGSPLTRVDGGFIPIGCYSAASVQTTTKGATIWISSTNQTGQQVVMMENLKVSIISTPEIDRLITSFFTAGDSAFASCCLSVGGKNFYIVTDGLTLIYDIDEKLWYIWTNAAGSFFDIVDVINGTLIQGRGTTIKQAADCFVNPTDDGTIIQVDIYTPNFDAGSQRIKTLSNMAFSADQVPGSILKVRRNDSDYDQTKWSNFREVNLGNKRPMLVNEGSFRRRAYNFRHQQPLPFRITSADLFMRVGTK